MGKRLTWPLPWFMVVGYHPHVRFNGVGELSPDQRAADPKPGDWEFVVVDRHRVWETRAWRPHVGTSMEQPRYIVQKRRANREVFADTIFSTEDPLELRCWLQAKGYLHG